MDTTSPEISAREDDDYVDLPVPASRRYGSLSMGLLWITMMTSFPTCLLGFEWYRDGFSFNQVLGGSLLSAGIVFAYTALSSYMGALTGLNYALLAKHVFGKVGAKLVCASWSILFFLWYGYMAGSIACQLKGLFNLAMPVTWLAIVFAILMSLNNIFGFKGVTNFARYLAAPALIAWIGFTSVKAIHALPAAALVAHGKQTWQAAFATICPMVIGTCIWGNEPDFWRFGQPKKLATVAPILLAVLIGQMLFPATGWMVACLGNVGDPNSAGAFLNTFTFGNNTFAAAAIMVISYFAINDGNLYGAINGFESIFHSTRGGLILPLIAMSCALAAWLSVRADALDLCASFNAFLLPTVTIIIAAEYFLFKGILHRVSEDAIFKSIAWPATIALVAAWTVGVLASGNVSATQSFHSGVWPLHSWCTAGFVYLALRLWAHGKPPLLVPAQDHRRASTNSKRKELETAGRNPTLFFLGTALGAAGASVLCRLEGYALPNRTVWRNCPQRSSAFSPLFPVIQKLHACPYSSGQVFHLAQKRWVITNPVQRDFARMGTRAWHPLCNVLFFRWHLMRKRNESRQE